MNTGITGVVLAGGKSERMGEDKGLMPFRGKPLVAYPLQLMEQFCSEILISAHNQAYTSFGYPVVADQVSGLGPMGGLYSCMLSSANDLHLFLSCDMPLISPAIIRLMLPYATQYEAVVPSVAGEIIPVCGFYHKDILPYLSNEIGLSHLKMKRFLSQLNTQVVDVQQPELISLFRNINTPADFDALNQNDSL